MSKKKGKVNYMLNNNNGPNSIETAEEQLENLVEFEEWFSLREDKIPPQHHREIIKADFNARKVPKMATLEQFDEALKKYGVTLN